MPTLLLAEHDNKTLKDATNKALTAAKAIGGEVHVLVAGSGCKVVAEAAAKLDGVAKVLLADAPAYEHMLAEPTAALSLSRSPALTTPSWQRRRRAEKTSCRASRRCSTSCRFPRSAKSSRRTRSSGRSMPATPSRPCARGGKRVDHCAHRGFPADRRGWLRRRWSRLPPRPIPAFQASSARNSPSRNARN